MKKASTLAWEARRFCAWRKSIGGLVRHSMKGSPPANVAAGAGAWHIPPVDAFMRGMRSGEGNR